MGSPKREKGVLKLVHPGRHIEYHRQPITAADVIKRNPRHCVTRPDVFKYPWIVVKPESVLIPGNVFFIVPNLTIHGLLKARGFYDQASQNLSPNSHLHSSLKSSAGRTRKHHFGNISQVRENREGKEFDGISIDTSRVKSKIYKNTIRTVYSSSDLSSSSGLALSEFKKGDQEIVCQKHIRMMKSCIRSEDSIHRWVKLRVTFDLTTKTTEIESPRLQQQGILL